MEVLVMLKKKIEAAFNEQMNAEMYSAYLYLSMAAYFESTGMPGFANWMRVQAQEEMVHAMKFFDHIIERGGRVTLKAIEGPETEWDSPVKVFEHVYQHEQKVTGLINNLVDLAIEESDHASRSFLGWFVDEQVEEEDSASTVLDRVKMIGGSGNGLFMMDRELGQRVFTPPASSQG
jgi:ferritin